MNNKTAHTDKAKNVSSSQTQRVSDEEIFDKAKIDVKKLDRYTQSKIVQLLVDFGENLADMKLYPYQRDFSERIAWSIIMSDGETIAVEFARQSGKSTTVSVSIPSFSVLLPLLAQYMEQANIHSPILKFKKGFWTGVYAPDYERAGIIGRKVNNVLSTNHAKEILTDPTIGMTFPDRLSNYLSNLPRQSLINVKSASRKVSIEGDTYHLVVTDETQEISDYVLKKSISPMLAATAGTTVHLGSAYSQRVYFYDITRMLKKDDIGKPKNKRNYYGIDYRVAQKYNKFYKSYIEKQKKLIGEDSDEFKMSYCLFWTVEKGMLITEEEFVQKCGQEYTVTNYDKTNDHVMGLDIAKTTDSTVLTAIEVDWDNPILIDAESRLYRHKKKIKNWLEIGGVDYDSQFYMICDFLNNYKWSKMVVDATGVGSPIYDRLKNKYEPQGKVIVPFVYNRADKSYGYTLLVREIQADVPRLFFPNSESAKKLQKQRKFIEQMSNLAREIVGGYLVVRHTSDTGHDDFPDCYSPDTEILTTRGFIKFPLLCSMDKVASWDIRTKNIRFVKPKQIFSKKSDGVLIHLKGEQIDQLVTKRHKIPFVRPASTNTPTRTTCVRLAQHFIGLSDSYLRTLAFFNAGKVVSKYKQPSDEDLKMIGWMVTEGWVTKSKKWNDARYQIAQSEKKNPEYCREIRRTIKKLNLSFNEYKRKDGVVFWQFRKESKKYFDSLLPNGVHTIPYKLLGVLNTRSCKIIVDTMMKGDGTRCRRSTYSSKSKELAEQFQLLSILSGTSCAVHKIHGNMYSAYLHKHKRHQGQAGIQRIEEIPYKGKVWCVTVDTGFIVVRRDGKISVSGNSLMQAVYGVEEAVTENVEEVIENIYRTHSNRLTKNSSDTNFWRR